MRPNEQPGEFDSLWSAYEKTFRARVDVEAYEAMLTAEVRRRAAGQGADLLE